MDYGGAWQAGARYGSCGSAPADAPASPCVTSSESSPGVEPTYGSNSGHDPYFLTTQCAHPAKSANDARLGIGVFGGGGREEWVADSGATSHLTGDPSGMNGSEPPPVGRSSLVVGDMRPLRIESFGKLPLAMHCAKGDVHVELLDMAYAAGVLLVCSPYTW